jgi:hypothetical protein
VHSMNRTRSITQRLLGTWPGLSPAGTAVKVAIVAHAGAGCADWVSIGVQILQAETISDWQLNVAGARLASSMAMVR